MPRKSTKSASALAPLLQLHLAATSAAPAAKSTSAKKRSAPKKKATEPVATPAPAPVGWRQLRLQLKSQLKLHHFSKLNTDLHLNSGWLIRLCMLVTLNSELFRRIFSVIEGRL